MSAVSGVDSDLRSPNGIRKRTRKACDRCRLKKGKCDGSCPCSRCKADNLVCCFSEAKRLHNRNHPKGYAEMLERQQSQLIAGLQTLYSRLQKSSSWDGPPLRENGSGPLTQDILAALDLLEPKEDGSGQMEQFEETTLEKQRLDSAYASAASGSSNPFDFPVGTDKSPPTDQNTPPSPHQEHSSTIASPFNVSPTSMPSPKQLDFPQNEHKQVQSHLQYRNPRPLLAKPRSLHHTPLQPIWKGLPPLQTNFQQPHTSAQAPSSVVDPQLYSPILPQSVADIDDHCGLDLDTYATTRLFNHPLDLLKDPPVAEKESQDTYKRPLWQRRLGIDSTDSMSEFANLSPLDTRNLHFGNASSRIKAGVGEV